MDYLVRDSHFAGVAIGRFDVHYLIHSIVVVNHGADGPRTLGITPKGVKAYEAFLLARRLMNRTAYYHHKVKVLEFMMEHFLRLVIKHMEDLKAVGPIAPFLPAYLKRIAVSGDVDKTKLMTKGYQDYIRLTEDTIWALIAAVADNAAVPIVQSLAQKLLIREILPHHIVDAGKVELLRETLLQEGLVEDRDFHLLDFETTMYERDGDEEVFVLDWQGDIDEVGKHSDTISVFRDRPETECLLVVIDPANGPTICEIGKKRKLIVVR